MAESNFQMFNGTTQKILEWLNGRSASISITLGSGLGGFGKDVAGVDEISYEEIGFPKCRAPGHAGILRYLPTRPGVLVLDGRVHSYEGHDMQTVVMPVRAMALIGTEINIITCASGGVNPELEPGQLVVIKDHINFSGQSPLVGLNDKFGQRFPYMSHAYDLGLRRLACRVSFNQKFELKEVVHAMMRGPSFETPAEVEMLHRLGVDTVGMSTVPEVIALRHLGARALAISCVTNKAAGGSGRPITEEEVAEAGQKATPRFRELLFGIIEQLRDS